MSLAFVQLSTSEFGEIYDHVSSHNPAHRNMHMRTTRRIDDQTELRYLHAMRASEQRLQIDGAISGPDVFWRYRLAPTPKGIAMTVMVQAADQRARRRILKRFLPEIFTRIDQERSGGAVFTNYAEGQLYLRRGFPGTPATDPRCQRAVADGILDPRFVDELEPWHFRLHAP